MLQERWYDKPMSTAPEFVYLRQIGYTGSLADMRNAYFNDLINGKTTPFGGDSAPTVGEYIPDIESWVSNGANNQPPSGQVRFTFFTAKKTESITGLTIYSGSIAAAATPTLCRMGVYSVDNAAEDLTLVASTPNDTALFAATNTAYQRNFSAPWNKIAGKRYAFGVLVVSAAATPSFAGSFIVAGAGIPSLSNLPPRRMATLAGQTDLPASVSAASLATSHMKIGAYLA